MILLIHCSHKRCNLKINTLTTDQQSYRYAWTCSTAANLRWLLSVVCCAPKGCCRGVAACTPNGEAFICGVACTVAGGVENTSNKLAEFDDATGAALVANKSIDAV